MGINHRNIGYTLRWNDRRFYPLVDDKLQTKRICGERGIPTARVLGSARVNGEIRGFVRDLEKLDGFALKPAHGAMGNGIMVVRSRTERGFLTAGGREVALENVSHHVASIVSGLFSLGGQPDVAFAEELLKVHHDFEPIAVDGVPDVRVVVFRGVPVMAMTRLPTKRSRGRANLHQGAVGAGVDLVTGRTRHAVVGTAPVELHPDTGERLIDVPIPGFERALEIVLEATDATELGYVGGDVVVDAEKGALILELNARPGLGIQVANRAGLLPRLRRIEERVKAGSSVEERIALGREIAAG